MCTTDRNLDPGYYWVHLGTDWGEQDEPDNGWYVAEWDGDGWYICGDEQQIYVSVIGPKIEPPCE